MKNNLSLKIIIISTLTAVFINIFFGRLIAAKISTWPVLNRLQILNPQAPIVINTREEVRVSETGDVVKTVNAAKSKISAVVMKGSGNILQLGTAINLTSDGLFLTVESVIAGKQPNQLVVKLDNGKFGEVNEIIRDPATGLVVLKTGLNGMGLADLGESDQLTTGERVVLLDASLQDYLVSFQDSNISEDQESDMLGKFSSDFPTRSFVLTPSVSKLPGEAVVDLKNRFMGIRDGETVISSDVIKDFLVRFLANSGNALRPEFGFEYRITGKLESELLEIPFGAVIEKISAGSPSQKAGLKINDVLIAVGGQSINQENSLEKLLGKYKPGDEVIINILRQNIPESITIIPAELK